MGGEKGLIGVILQVVYPNYRIGTIVPAASRKVDFFVSKTVDIEGYGSAIQVSLLQYLHDYLHWAVLRG
jgi:hypothetical protein